jgi:hypothetical protein
MNESTPQRGPYARTPIGVSRKNLVSRELPGLVPKAASPSRSTGCIGPTGSPFRSYGKPKIEQIARDRDCRVTKDRAERGYVTRVLAVVIVDPSFEQSISFIGAHLPSLRAYRHQP